MGKITMYTDGGCRGNGHLSMSIGAYGIVILKDDMVYYGSGAQPLTTNNRMEFLAVINGLNYLDTLGVPHDTELEVISDSMLMLNTVTKWAEKWCQQDWSRKNPTKDNNYRHIPPKNLDLVKKLYYKSKEWTNVTWTWVKGHDVNIYNNKCDSLCNEAMDKLEEQLKEHPVRLRRLANVQPQSGTASKG